MSGKDFSEELNIRICLSVLKAGHHVKLTLKLSDDLLLDVAKVEIKKETITSDILMDWLPKPKVEAKDLRIIYFPLLRQRLKRQY